MTFKTCIVDKTEADAKRRKLNPTNSEVVQKAINREVEHANKDDLKQNGIHQREPRANIKRECMFDVTTQGNKVSKRETQAILNIIGAGKPR